VQGFRVDTTWRSQKWVKINGKGSLKQNNQSRELYFLSLFKCAISRLRDYVVEVERFELDSRVQLCPI
jgi:hypothetical protein